MGVFVVDLRCGINPLAVKMATGLDIVPGSAADLIESSKICYEGFYKLNTHNGVKPPFSSDKNALDYLKSAFESKNIKFCVMKEDRSVSFSNSSISHS